MEFTRLEPTGVNTSAQFTFANVAAGNVLTDNLLYANGDPYTLGGGGSSTIDGANVTGQVANALIAGTVYTNAQPNITSVGTLSSVDITGNITSGNASLGNLVVANYFSGNGSLLTSIAGSNVVGQVANALISGTVYTNAQPNITSVGTLSGLTVSGITSLGAVTDVKITGGLTNQVLTTDGLGNLTWAAGGGGGGSSGGAGFITVTKDVFTATGSANTYTLSITPASAAYVVVNIDGIVQQLSSYSLSTNQLTISGMPASGEIIEITSYGVGGLPGGSTTEVQFNDNGVFQGAPAFTFDSASSTLSVTNITGNITTAAQPNITSVGTLTSVTTGNLQSTGWTTLQESSDVLTTKTSATGTVVHDITTGAVFYHSSISANFTVNFTNVATTDNRSTVVTLILAQGATPYYANACQIDGVGQTIKWPSATAPTAAASRTEFQNFVLIRVGGAWVVTSSLSSYG